MKFKEGESKDYYFIKEIDRELQYNQTHGIRIINKADGLLTVDEYKELEKHNLEKKRLEDIAYHEQKLAQLKRKLHGI